MTSSGQPSVWGADDLDLGAYLERVSYTGPLRADVATLRALHRAHVSSVPFENLDIVLGRPIELDAKSLQAKIVVARRGGYCHEHNGLFAAVLERLGTPFCALSARATFGSDAPRPMTHMCLCVLVDGQRWLADVGFGADGLLEPMPFEDGAVATAAGGTAQYRLRALESGRWALQSRREHGWLELYNFSLEPRWPIDYRVLNWYTSTHPRSPFTSRVIAQRVAADDDRRFLVGDTFTEVGPRWRERSRPIAPSELDEILRHHIGIQLGADELDVLGRALVTAPRGGSASRGVEPSG